MTEATSLYLRFPDAETALEAARALCGNLSVTELPPDGWLGGIHYDIAVIGADGVLHDAAGAALPGYHVNGLWRGSDETVPAALQDFRIYPASPSVIWG